MGYSLMANIRSKKARKDMLAFLDKNFNPSKDITDKLDMHIDYLRGPTDDLSYKNGRKNVIGFDYTCLNSETNHFLYCMCVWIARMVGRKIEVDGVKYDQIVYDGYSVWVLCDESEKLELDKKLKGRIEDTGESGAVSGWDEIGYRDFGQMFRHVPLSKLYKFISRRRIRKVNEFTLAFLQDLTKRYKEWPH